MRTFAGIALISLARVAVVAGSCTRLEKCTDSAPFGLGSCKTTIAGGFYCADFSAYGTQCNACSCKSGCESDMGSGTPRDWRPGKTNPYGSVTSSSNGGPIDFSAEQKAGLVAQHNFVRAYHGACPLQWSDDITQVVKNTALGTWKSSCKLEHTDNSARSGKSGDWGTAFLGENLASASSMYYANNFPVDPKTMAWYLEEYDYDYSNPGSSTGGAIGHFTQVVWKETTHIGCVMYQCDYQYGKTVLMACQYGPGGNMAGAYAANVGERGSAASCGGGGPPPSVSPSAGPAAAPKFNPTCSDGESAPVSAGGVTIQWTLGEGPSGEAAIRFRLSMSGAGANDWFAVGIGAKTGMKNWDVHAAYPQGGSCSGDCIGDYWSASKSKPTKDSSQDVNLISATSEEVLFWRPIAQTEGGSDLEISGEQKLWYAKGSGNPSDGGWGYHSGNGRGVLSADACFTCGGCAAPPEPTVSPSGSPVKPPTTSPAGTPSASPVKAEAPTTSPVTPGTPTTSPARQAPPTTSPVKPGTPTTSPARQAPPTTSPYKPGTPTTSPVTPGTPTTSPIKSGTPTTSPAKRVSPPTFNPLPAGSPTKSPATTKLPTKAPTVSAPTKAPLPAGSPTESPATSLPPTSPPLGQGETHRPTTIREAADWEGPQEETDDSSWVPYVLFGAGGVCLLCGLVAFFVIRRRKGTSIAKFFEETDCGTDGMGVPGHNQSVPAGMVGQGGYGELPMTSI